MPSNSPHKLRVGSLKTLKAAGCLVAQAADGSMRDIYARYGVEHQPPTNRR